MKVLSVVVPCYNSEGYMRHCLDTLLTGGEDVEIIIVDDGSTKDNTAAIADEYEKKYPDIVLAIHQENGGHGEAVNTGLRYAGGRFFKVVDSDDWVNEESYKKILAFLKENMITETPLDMLISNYVYEKVGARRKKVIQYRNALPVETYFTWDDIKHFKVDQYILMHSVIYRTELLRECQLSLPAHTFYVDNLFVFEPLPYVKNMYYIDTNFYRYFIGRADQSVNEEIMISRIDQQIRVTKTMIDYFHFDKIENKRCRYYMINYLKMMMMVPSIMLILSGTQENLAKKKELWSYLKTINLKLWFKIRFSRIGSAVNIPGRGGRKISKLGYKVYQRFIGFN
ncbi:MAG: glycosyltransferase [Lachnospiraceae bacterium]|nr:glycosyltransferase [Lachnospiraceae bacterium]